MRTLLNVERLACTTRPLPQFSAPQSSADGWQCDLQCLEQAVQAEFDHRRQQQQEQRALTEIIGDGAADLVFHIGR